MKPRALDLFCCAGGVTRGLQRAGFHVTGCDIVASPRYCGDAFIQADALTVALDGYDFIWASPPCQRYITGGLVNRERAPDLVAPIRARLEQSEAVWCIENVPGAPLRRDLTLCGSMFGLSVRRHRVFEMSLGQLAAPRGCNHSRPAVGVYGHPHGESGAWPGMLPGTLASWSAAMGIDWMAAPELAQSIPPAFSEFIGRAAMRAMLETAENYQDSNVEAIL